MLRLLFPSLFVMTSARVSLASFKQDDFCQLTNIIAKATAPYQIVLVVDESAHRTRIRECIIRRHPTLSIDVNHLGSLERILSYPVLGSARYSTLFIGISSSGLSRLEPLFDVYGSTWSRPIRPKWLAIDLGAKGNSEGFLFSAWGHKFLDCTVLEVSRGGDFLVRHYNPFDGSFTAERLTDDTNIFPDKLHDMRGYKLNTIFVHEPPSLFIARDDNGAIVQLNGTDFWTIEAIAKTMNFCPVFLPTFADDYTNAHRRQSFTNLNKAIYEGRIEFGGNRLYLWEHETLERSYKLWPDGYCALVPVLPKESLKLPNSFCLALLCFLVFGLILGLAVKMLRFDRRFWTWMMMSQVH